MEITRHFSSTVLIVHHDRVLLHRHRKRGSLLPMSGHVNRDELPQDAAVRKAREDAGLEIRLHDSDHLRFSDVQTLVRPMHMVLVDLNPYHQHIDFIFYATAGTDHVQAVAGESEQLFWYTRDELLTTPMPENIRGLALEALALLGNH